MANNRMYLKCKVCGEMQMIAKFYPKGGFITGPENAGWYMPDTVSPNMDKYFEEHEHDLDSSSLGGYQYELVYETPKE